MKKLLLFLALALPALSQTKTYIRFQSTAPSGACATSGPMAYNYSANVLYGCQSGTWTAASGGSSLGTVTSVIIAGTANQIAVAGVCTITDSGTCTLSIPNNPTLPGTTTGTFVGNLTGNASGSAATITGVIVEANTPLTTKGDLLVEDGATLHRLAVGADGQALIADSASTDGVKWATVAGAVTSVVIAGTANQITASGTCTITTTGTCTLSIPSSPTLPGTTTLTPSIGATSWASANHAHAAANSGGQIAFSALTGAVTAAQLPNSGVMTGDVTTTFPAVTVAKVNGIAYSATAAAHSIEVITTANATATAKTLPDCDDTGGNHLNFDTATDNFSCGTSGGGGGSANSVFTGSTATASAFAATPTFSLADVSVKSPVRFEPGPMTANVTAVTFSNKTAGAKFSLVWVQDATGGRTVTYGASATNACVVDTTASATTTQFFEVAADGTTVNGTGCSGTSNLISGPENSAPGTPASSTWVAWGDFTNHIFSFKANNSATVSNTVVPSSLAANNFATGISAAGVILGAQPAFTNISGAAIAAQLPNSGVMTGDITTTFPAVTVSKVNGIAYSATAALHTVQVTTTANTTVTAKVIPDCTDTGGNHLNFTQSTDAFSCGTSGTGGGVSAVSGDGIFITNSSSSGAVTLTLGTAAAHKVWMNNTGSTAAPGYQSIGTADLPAALANQTSINGLAISASTGTLTIANGKTITLNNTITLASTDGITITTPSTSFTVARIDSAQTFTGVQSFTTPAATDNSTTAATTAYVTTAVANAIAAVNPAVAVQAATAAALPTVTYANGVSGIGATLTQNSAAVLVVDGYTVLLNDRLLVKNQASTFQNGVYLVTTLGTGSVPFVLTRALDFDQPSDMNNTGLIPVDNNGTANAKTGWYMTSIVTTVGTDAVTFTQFAVNSANIVSAVSPGVGLGHFAGSTQTLTSSLVVSADLNVTTTTCTNQFIRAITATVGGTCSTIATADIPSSIGLTTPAISGLPTGSGVASAATASTLAARDSSANISANSFIDGYTTTVTAAGTTTLTVASTELQYFTGSTTQTVTLPVTSTLVLGQRFHIVNNSTGAVTINSSGGNAVLILAGNTNAFVTCILTSGTTAASWSANAYEGIVITSGKSLSVNNTLTLVGTDSTTMTFPTTSATIARTDAANTFTGTQTFNTAIGVASGGTGLATLTAHAVYVGNGASAPTALSVGATNTVLRGSTGADPAFGAIVQGDLPATTRARGIGFSIGDAANSSALTTSSVSGYVTVPFACTIAGYNLGIDAGTITVKFWKIATGTAVPTVSNVINTSGVGISSGTAIHSTTVSDFTTTTVTANDIMAMAVTAVATAKTVTGVLECTQ